MRSSSFSDNFPYVLIFKTLEVALALAYLINSTSVVLVYYAQREKFVKSFGALKPYSLGRLFSLFKVIMKWHLFVPFFFLCFFIFLCPLLPPFYLRGCH